MLFPPKWSSTLKKPGVPVGLVDSPSYLCFGWGWGGYIARGSLAPTLIAPERAGWRQRFDTISFLNEEWMSTFCLVIIYDYYILGKTSFFRREEQRQCFRGSLSRMGIGAGCVGKSLPISHLGRVRRNSVHPALTPGVVEMPIVSAHSIQLLPLLPLYPTSLIL